MSENIRNSLDCFSESLGEIPPVYSLIKNDHLIPDQDTDAMHAFLAWFNAAELGKASIWKGIEMVEDIMSREISMMTDADLVVNNDTLSFVTATSMDTEFQKGCLDCCSSVRLDLLNSNGERFRSVVTALGTTRCYNLVMGNEDIRDWLFKQDTLSEAYVETAITASVLLYITHRLLEAQSVVEQSAN